MSFFEVTLLQNAVFVVRNTKINKTQSYRFGTHKQVRCAAEIKAGRGGEDTPPENSGAFKDATFRKGENRDSLAFDKNPVRRVVFQKGRRMRGKMGPRHNYCDFI